MSDLWRNYLSDENKQRLELLQRAGCKLDVIYGESGQGAAVQVSRETGVLQKALTREGIKYEPIINSMSIFCPEAASSEDIDAYFPSIYEMLEATVLRD